MYICVYTKTQIGLNRELGACVCVHAIQTPEISYMHDMAES